MKRLAIITTHPIQYYAPVFKLLAAQIEIMVFYTWGEASMLKYDPGFGKTVVWDVDLLDGYPYQWVKNIAAQPGSHHFNGINNPDLIDQVTAWQPDTLLVYGWAYKSHLNVLKHFKGKVTILFRGDSTLLSPQKTVKKLLRSIYLKWVYKHIDYALYVGSNNKAYFKHYGLKEPQLIFAPHAVDNSRFSAPRTDEARQLRLSLQISDDATLLLYAGKFEPVKNLQSLLSAFISVDKPNSYLLLVGNGPEETALKKAAFDSKAASRIRFLDFSNQTYMPVIYQAADIVCLPSVSETWGLAINEAMACAKPILASDAVGCAIDLVEPGVNGYIFKTNDNADIVIKLNTLLEKSKQQLFSMGQASAKKIETWSYINQVQSILNYTDERDS